MWSGLVISSRCAWRWGVRVCDRRLWFELCLGLLVECVVPVVGDVGCVSGGAFLRFLGVWGGFRENDEEEEEEEEEDVGALVVIGPIPVKGGRSNMPPLLPLPLRLPLRLPPG